MSLKANIAANFLGRIWSFLALYLFANIYIHLVGMQAYGILSIYTLVLGVISFIDAGLSSSVNREFAKDNPATTKLLVLLYTERMYVVLCTVVVLVICLFAGYLSKFWFSSNHVPVDNLILYIRLIGIGVGLQLIPSVYLGALMGLEKQVWCNSAQIVWSIVKNVGGVAVLYFGHLSLTCFFWWQIICNLLYLIITRWKILSLFVSEHSVAKVAQNKMPPGFWKYIAGMAGISLLSAINIQGDKIVTSKIFSLADFGYYSLASLISQIPVLIATPIVIAVFPRLTKLLSEGRQSASDHYVLQCSRLVTCVIIPAGIFICFYNQILFEVWFYFKKQVGQEFGRLNYVTIFLCIGNIFLAFQLIPFYLLLAKGKTKYTIYQGIVQMIFMIPGLYYFSGRYGLDGIGIPWMVINFVGFVYLLFILRNYLSLRILQIIVMDTGRIALLSGIIIYTVYFWSRSISHIGYLFIGGVSVVFCIGCCMLLTLKSYIFRLFSSRSFI